MAQRPLPALAVSSDAPAFPTTTKTSSCDSHAIHMTLQHKGGVGKSFVANCIAQYYASKGRPIKVIDADPSNKSLAAYKALSVVALDIMAANNTVDSRKFDDMMDDIIGSASDFVIDNGATNFLPFMAYLVENRVTDVLAEHGRELMIHVPIVGAEARMETLQGFDDIASNIGQNAKVVVWLMEAIKGVILFDGKDFEATKAYAAHQAKIHTLIRVPHHTSELFAQDMDELLSKKLTFAEAINGTDFRLMARQRLRQMQREIFDQVALAI